MQVEALSHHLLHEFELLRASWDVREIRHVHRNISAIVVVTHLLI
jgi:hypothetical protein